MKITKIETIRHEPLANEGVGREAPEIPPGVSQQLLGFASTRTRDSWTRGNVLWARAVSALIHDTFAPLLLGRNPLDIENHWNNLFSICNFFGFAGAEMRAMSAIDFALWDICRAAYGRADLQPFGRPQPGSSSCLQHLCGIRALSDYTAWMEGHSGDLARDLLAQGIRR